MGISVFRILYLVLPVYVLSVFTTHVFTEIEVGFLIHNCYVPMSKITNVILNSRFYGHSVFIWNQ